MLRISRCGPDLLLDDLDLALDLLSDDTGIRDPVPDLLDLSFEFAQLLPARLIFLPVPLEKITGFFEISLNCLFVLFYRFQLGQVLLVLQKEKIDVSRLQGVSLLEEYLGLLRLSFQCRDLFLQFGEDIVDPDQILLLAGELLQGHILASLELDDSHRFVEEFPAVLGLVTEDLVDLPLAYDRVAFLADSGVVEKLVNISEPARRAVHQILRLAASVDPSRHGHFLVVRGKFVVGIVQCDSHVSISHGLSRFRAGKYDVLHGGAAQLLDPLLAQHPADSVRHIALSAAVGPYDSRDPVMKVKSDLVGKRFKALDLDTF